MEFSVENIRSSDQLQVARADTYLLENADPGVRPRSADQLAEAIDGGQGLLISAGARIAGISLVYQYDPRGPFATFYEIGTMRVTVEGFGLQVFLAKLHLMQIFLTDDATRGDIFAVVAPGTASQHNLVKHVGMADWSPPDLLKLVRDAAGVPFVPGKSVIAANDTAISKAFSDLRTLHIKGKLFRTPKGDATIDVAMNWFSEDLLNLGP